VGPIIVALGILTKIDLYNSGYVGLRKIADIIARNGIFEHGQFTGATAINPRPTLVAVVTKICISIQNN